MEQRTPVSKILTADDFSAASAALQAARKTLLLQMGSESCVKCPAFAEAIVALGELYQFEWVYCDAHHEDSDLPEHFAVTQLPAVVVVGPDDRAPSVIANASHEALGLIVREKCAPVLRLDEDF